MFSWLKETLGFEADAKEVNISKSHMRDAIKRVENILKVAFMYCVNYDRAKYEGELSEDMINNTLSEGGGMMLDTDPVEKTTNKFMNHGTLLRDKIQTINEMRRTGTGGSAGELAKDSHDINIIMRDMRHELENIKDAYIESQQKMNKYKGKNEEKKAKYEATYAKYKTYYETCNKLMETMIKLKLEREEETETVAGGGASSGPVSGVKTTIDKFIKRRRTALCEKSGDLRENEETAVQMKMLDSGKKKQNELLEQLGNVVNEITESIKRIGVELDTQNAILRDQDKKVGTYTDRLVKMNAGLDKYLGESKSSNNWLYVIACLLISAIVGYFVTEFVKF